MNKSNELPFAAGDRVVSERDGFTFNVKIMAICEATGRVMLCFQDTGTWKLISEVVEKINKGIFTVKKLEAL